MFLRYFLGMSHNSSYEDSSLTTYASVTGDDDNTLSGATFGSVFTLSRKTGVGNCNDPKGQCYVDCSCNTTNGWFAPTASGAPTDDYIEVTTTMADGGFAYLEGVLQKNASNIPTPAPAKCRKAKCPNGYFKDKPTLTAAQAEYIEIVEKGGCYAPSCKYKTSVDYSVDGVSKTATAPTAITSPISCPAPMGYFVYDNCQLHYNGSEWGANYEFHNNNSGTSVWPKGTIDFIDAENGSTVVDTFRGGVIGATQLHPGSNWNIKYSTSGTDSRLHVVVGASCKNESTCEDHGYASSKSSLSCNSNQTATEITTDQGLKCWYCKTCEDHGYASSKSSLSCNSSQTATEITTDQGLKCWYCKENEKTCASLGTGYTDVAPSANDKNYFNYDEQTLSNGTKCYKLTGCKYDKSTYPGIEMCSPSKRTSGSLTCFLNGADNVLQVHIFSEIGKQNDPARVFGTINAYASESTLRGISSNLWMFPTFNGITPSTTPHVRLINSLDEIGKTSAGGAMWENISQTEVYIGVSSAALGTNPTPIATLPAIVDTECQSFTYNGTRYKVMYKWATITPSTSTYCSRKSDNYQNTCTISGATY